MIFIIFIIFMMISGLEIPLFNLQPEPNKIHHSSTLHLQHNRTNPSFPLSYKKDKEISNKRLRILRHHH